MHNLEEGFPLLSQDELKFEASFITHLNDNIIVVAGETSVSFFSVSPELQHMEVVKTIEQATDSVITAIGHKNGDTLVLTGFKGDLSFLKLTTT